MVLSKDSCTFSRFLHSSYKRVGADKSFSDASKLIQSSPIGPRNTINRKLLVHQGAGVRGGSTQRAVDTLIVRVMILPNMDSNDRPYNPATKGPDQELLCMLAYAPACCHGNTQEDNHLAMMTLFYHASDYDLGGLREHLRSSRLRMQAALRNLWPT